MKPTGDTVEYWENYHGTLGSAHGVSHEAPPGDVIERLHQVVEEITGEPMRKPDRRIGFV